MSDMARAPRRAEAAGARLVVAITLVTLGVAVLVARHLCLGQWKGRRRAAPEPMQAQVNLATVWVLGALAWPLLFDAVVGLASLRPIPALSFSLIWPLVLLSFELHSLGHQTFDHQARASQGALRWESNSVSSLAFAVGGFIAARRTAQPHLGARPKTRAGAAGATDATDAADAADAGAVQVPAHLPAAVVSAVVILCVAFILPSPSLQARSAVNVAVYALQRTCLIYCLGLILATVLTASPNRRVVAKG
jgi:hypothetical protein